MSLIVTFSAVIKERFISTCRKCKRKFRKRRDERKEARECGPSAPPETLPLSGNVLSHFLCQRERALCGEVCLHRKQTTNYSRFSAANSFLKLGDRYIKRSWPLAAENYTLRTRTGDSVPCGVRWILSGCPKLLAGVTNAGEFLVRMGHTSHTYIMLHQMKNSCHFCAHADSSIQKQSTSFTRKTHSMLEKAGPLSSFQALSSHTASIPFGLCILIPYSTIPGLRPLCHSRIGRPMFLIHGRWHGRSSLKCAASATFVSHSVNMTSMAVKRTWMMSLY